MHPCAWSCLSCGRSNAPEATVCVVCRCSATPTTRQIEHARQRFLERGGQVPPTAPSIERPDPARIIKFVTWALVALATGYVPSKVSPAKQLPPSKE